MYNGFGNVDPMTVEQASGMVSVQAKCSVVAAFTLMSVEAARADLTMDEIATLVVARDIDYYDEV